MAAARSNLECEYEERLELIRVEAEGRTTTLKAKLDEVTQRADAAGAALGASQAELASSRAEVLLLHQRVDAAEAVARRSEDEIRQRQTLGSRSSSSGVIHSLSSGKLIRIIKAC